MQRKIAPEDEPAIGALNSDGSDLFNDALNRALAAQEGHSSPTKQISPDAKRG